MSQVNELQLSSKINQMDIDSKFPQHQKTRSQRTKSLFTVPNKFEINEDVTAQIEPEKGELLPKDNQVDESHNGIKDEKKNFETGLIPSGEGSNSEDQKPENVIPIAQMDRVVKDRWLIVDLPHNHCKYCNIEQPIRTKVLFNFNFDKIWTIFKLNLLV